MERFFHDSLVARGGRRQPRQRRRLLFRAELDAHVAVLSNQRHVHIRFECQHHNSAPDALRGDAAAFGGADLSADPAADASADAGADAGGGSAGVEAGGSDGPICEPEYVAKDGWQCYKSCEALGYCTAGGGGGRCRWSTCLSDAAFVVAILKSLDAPHDAARVYSTGHSNGAMVQWGLIADPLTAGVFAAIAPVSGIPHNGFNVGFAAAAHERRRSRR